MFFVPSLVEEHIVKSVVKQLLHLLWIEARIGGKELLVAEKRLQIGKGASCPIRKQAYVGDDFWVLGVDGLGDAPKEIIDS